MAEAVAVASGVTVGVGDGVEHKLKSVVQDAPRDGQQKVIAPQVAFCPTFPTFEQLISWGEPSTLDALQLLSKSGCPETGHAPAAGQVLPDAFSEIFCCCRTRSTPATTPKIKNKTMPIVITIVDVPIFPDFLLVIVSKGETAGLGFGMISIILYGAFILQPHQFFVCNLLLKRPIGHGVT